MAGEGKGSGRVGDTERESPEVRQAGRLAGSDGSVRSLRTQQCTKSQRQMFVDTPSPFFGDVVPLKH